MTPIKTHDSLREDGFDIHLCTTDPCDKQDEETKAIIDGGVESYYTKPLSAKERLHEMIYDEFEQWMRKEGYASGYAEAKCNDVYKAIDQIHDSAYSAGRQSVLDEIAEDQKKFLEGFAYKPNKLSDIV